MFIFGVILATCSIILFSIIGNYVGMIQEAFIIVGIVITATLALPCFGLGVAFLISDDFK